MSASKDDQSKLQALQEENRRLKQAVEELSILIDLSSEIGASLNSQDIMKKVIHRSLRAVHAEQGLITLVEPQAEKSMKTLVRSMVSSSEHHPFHLHQSLLGWMHLNKQPLLMNDPKHDKRFQGTEIDVYFHGQLTPMQEIAATDLARYDDGVFVAPPGLGKTLVGIYMIAARRRNTLVLVHRRPLLEQWRAQIANFLGMESSMIGQIGGGKEKRTGLVDVAMLQSLIRKNQVDDIVARACVKICRGFVRDNDLRVADNRPRYCHALTLAA